MSATYIPLDVGLLLVLEHLCPDAVGDRLALFRCRGHGVVREENAELFRCRWCFVPNQKTKSKRNSLQAVERVHQSTEDRDVLGKL